MYVVCVVVVWKVCVLCCAWCSECMFNVGVCVLCRLYVVPTYGSVMFLAVCALCVVCRGVR